MLGAVTFTAGERDYACAFTTSAMVAYEAKYDEPFLSLVNKLDGDEISNLRFSFLFELFALALRACDKDLEDEEIETIADQIPPKRIITLIGDAIRAAFPEEGKDGKKTAPVQSKKVPPKK